MSRRFLKEDGAYIKLLKDYNPSSKLIALCFYKEYMIGTYVDVPRDFRIDENLIKYIRFEREIICNLIDLKEFDFNKNGQFYNRIAKWWTTPNGIHGNFKLETDRLDKALRLSLNESIFNTPLLTVMDGSFEKWANEFIKFYSFEV